MNEKSLNRFVLVSLAVLWGTAPARAQAPPQEPLTLRRAVELAVERAPQLAAARASQEEGSASADLARDAFHPAAFLSTTPGYTYGLPTTVAGQVPAVAGLQIRQTIYDPGRRSAALVAEAGASALDASLAQSCRSTVEAAVAAYAKAYLDGALVEVARRRLEAADASARRMTALFEEGRRSQLDLERSTLQAARARQKLLNAQSDRDLDELELKRLIGWPGSAPLRLAGDPDAVLPELSSTENLAAVRAADPEIASLSREVDLLGQSASLESRRFAPVIEASASYLRLAKFNNYDDYYLTFTPNTVAVGVSVLVPLWTGGRRHDGERIARARLERAEADLLTREGDLEIAVRRAEAAVARSMAEKSISRRARGIADQTKSAEEILVREGRSELVDLDESEMALADADEEAARASLSATLERARLLSLRGDLGGAILGSEPPCAVRSKG
jgi:outer membrane protein TolC